MPRPLAPLLAARPSRNFGPGTPTVEVDPRSEPAKGSGASAGSTWEMWRAEPRDPKMVVGWIIIGLYSGTFVNGREFQALEFGVVLYLSIFG